MRKHGTINYHLMLLPGMILLMMFSIYPMFGAIIAFKRFLPAKGIWGSPWTGWDNFQYMFQIQDSKQILFNTLFIAIMKIIAGLIVPLLFALLLNEVRQLLFKRFVQTIVYLPHFLSWVLLGGILVDILSLNGMVNQFLHALGISHVFFLGSNHIFPFVLVGSDVWKEFGFSAIIYLAALTSINPALYEAADMDGATRMQKLIHITLPGITATIVLLATLSLGNVLNAGLDQVLNLYNPMVYQSGDIIDTYVYRIGLIKAQYGLATAIGLMKSVVSLVLITISYSLASRFANYRIF